MGAVTTTRFNNRELSWLDFDARVLALATDPAVPVLERAKFLAIFGQNLDEFYQVRVAGLLDQVEAGIVEPTPDGMTPAQQLAEISDRVEELVARADEVFVHGLLPALNAEGISFCTWDQLDVDNRRHLRQVFDDRILPILTPLAVDPAHPFPEISNLSLNLALRVVDPDDSEERFARLKIPPALPRYIPTLDENRLLPIEELVSAHLDRLFIGMKIEEYQTFRVTRNADLDLSEEDADDLLELVEMEIRRRRFGDAVRLEVPTSMSDEMVSLLQRELEVSDVHRHAVPLDLSGLWVVAGLDRPELKFPHVPTVDSRALAGSPGLDNDVFAILRRGDVLVHHPYENFSSSVEEFIRQAAIDRQVLAIKVTLYRTSGDSAIVASLVRAAEAGKQVVALVELKARFDEENNIAWARRLERAGVHVVYGLVGLKTHTKITMVARDEPDRVRVYCHVGTGNYNSRTARIYEDFGLFTASHDVADDVQNLFNYLTGYSRSVDYRRLLVAPDELRSRIVSLIRNERPAPIGTTEAGAGRIVMKMNSLVDPEMIDELYAASADGVQIDLIVRGICCLRPQVPGMSDNIRVRSIVGRFLEHSRIYRFANGTGPGEAALYLGSADLMPRNLDGRVEALIGVTNPALVDRIDSVLDIELADDMLAWELRDDTWAKVPTSVGVDAHVQLTELSRTWVSQAR